MKKIISLYHVIFLNSTISLSQGSGNCLQFDGVNDYIKVPFTLVKSNSSHTIEMWVNSSSSETGAIYSEANTVSNYKGQFRLAGNGSGKLVLYYVPSTTILVNNVTSTTTVFDGTWHHVALVGNGNSTTLYIDGVADATNFDYVRPTNAEAIEAGVGAQVQCCYATGNFSQPFGGRIDEVRLWSTSRPISSIRSNMTKKLSGNHSRLEVYYRLDQTSGTVVTDASMSTPSIDGSLTHPNLSAPYASWETSGASLGDESAYSYSVTSSTSLNLTSPDGDNFEANVTSITSTPNSIHLYRVDSPPNLLTPPGTQNQLSETHYYGVKVFGGTGVVYSIVFNYDGHIGITNENTLELAKKR
ncbi:LamG domain-containing protein [Reichenbachiella sp.]|uniref:LamG domain-containing protein n=1 Tax=Reichenbachiella sp. TaxID=2184521 RepID=UPI003297F9FA